VSQHGTTILFGLRGVRVREVVRHAEHGRVVHVLTDEGVRRRARSAGCCPRRSGSAARPGRGTCRRARSRWWCGGTSGSSPAGRCRVRARRSPSRSLSCRPALGSRVGCVVTTRTLAQAIERLGQQFEDRSDDTDYGLGEVSSRGQTPLPRRKAPWARSISAQQVALPLLWCDTRWGFRRGTQSRGARFSTASR
jgi:hypothetical protein